MIATVVRTSALPSRLARDSTSASTGRSYARVGEQRPGSRPVACRPTVSTMPSTTSSSRAGSGFSSMRRMARASRAGAPPRAGAEACPPGSVVLSSTSSRPFSASPTTAVAAWHAGEDAADDSAALVEHHPRADAARGQRLDGELRADAEDLLVVAEGQVDVAARREALGHQRLDGLEDRHEGALVVDRAAAVHHAVGDAARRTGRATTPARRPGPRRSAPSAPAGARRCRCAHR